MKRELCCVKHLGVSDGERERSYRLEYVLVEQEISLPFYPHGLLLYGVEVTKEGEGERESRQICQVCSKEGQMRRWIQQLARCLVTPVALQDVLEDLVCEEGM